MLIRQANQKNEECHRCHDLLNLSDIAILNIKGFDYCYIINEISENETINLMQNAGWTQKSETYKT